MLSSAVVLPEAEAERDAATTSQADDQPSAELLQMIDHADAVLMSDAANSYSHDLPHRPVRWLWSVPWWALGRKAP
jgi:hypothetical protein